MGDMATSPRGAKEAPGQQIECTSDPIVLLSTIQLNARDIGLICSYILYLRFVEILKAARNIYIFSKRPSFFVSSGVASNARANFCSRLKISCFNYLIC